MDKDAVIAVLQAHRAELEALGVKHAALFGSVARGEAGADSDIDIAVDLDDGKVGDIYAYVGVQLEVAALFSRKVDVVDRASLKPRVLAGALPDLLYAF